MALRPARLLVCLAAACGALAGGTGTADAAVKHPCSAKGSKTIQSTRLVRVYDVYNQNLKETLHYACYKPKNRRTYVWSTTKPAGADGSYSFDQSHIFSATRIVLRGRFAAAATNDCINPAYYQDRRSDCQTRVIVWDLRSGKVLYFHFASKDPPTQTYETAVKRIVLQTSGSVAWSTADARNGDGHHFSLNTEIATLTPSGYTLLAYGDNVNAESLALSGTTLSWLEDVNRHTATLR